MPFISDGIDDEDEVLLALASSLGRMVPHVGGPPHAHTLLHPLELLLTVKETLVRETAAASVQSISEQPSAETFQHDYKVEEYVVPGKGYRTQDDTQNSSDSPLPMNKLTPKEKLETALEMAESIAILHGYQDGVIVHDDVQLQQWLRAEDGSLKLGDFNRATILEWDPKKQQYCRYSNGAAFGNVSPLFAGRYD